MSVEASIRSRLRSCEKTLATTGLQEQGVKISRREGSGNGEKNHQIMQLMPRFNGTSTKLTDLWTSAEGILSTAPDQKLRQFIMSECQTTATTEGSTRKGAEEGKDTEEARRAAPAAARTRRAGWWSQENTDLYHILDVAFTGSARSCVQRFQRKINGLPDGVAAH